MSESFLHIYLEQEEHYIALSQMDKIIQSVNIIGNSLSEKLLNNLPKELFVIYPYEKGSFKVKIGVKEILLGSVASLIVGLSETDSGQAFVRGLTGNETPYYYEKIGEFVRDCVKGVFEKDIDELELINNLDKKYFLDKSIKAKSDLYESLYKSNNIKSVSFTPNNDLAIKRQIFYKHIKKNDIIRLLEPRYYIKDLIISKSINTKDKGKWSFKSIVDDDKKISAELLDDDFLMQFWNGKYPLKENDQDDTIRALLRIDTTMKNGSKEKEEYFIEEIFSFNENNIKDIPQNLEQYLKIKYNYKEATLDLW